jgi:shikimate kinase
MFKIKVVERKINFCAIENRMLGKTLKREFGIVHTGGSVYCMAWQHVLATATNVSWIRKLS